SYYLYCFASPARFVLFFFPDTSPPAIYTLSLHDALPIFAARSRVAGLTSPLFASSSDSDTWRRMAVAFSATLSRCPSRSTKRRRSEEHTSELQSRENLVCRLLLEKKKIIKQ